MIKDHVQKQEGGDTSTNLQGESIVINQGISYSDAKEIALDVYKANFLQLSQEASNLAVQRAEQLTDRFLEQLKKTKKDNVDSLRDPGMQIALYSAQKEYARTGDEDLQDLLVDILVERSSHTERDIKQIVLDESIIIAPKLTTEQFDALTMNFLICNTKNHGLLNLQLLEAYFDKSIIPFLGSLTNESSCYQHLEYLGCGSLMQIGTRHSIQRILREQYPGLFCKGFTGDEAKNKFDDLSKITGLLIPCLHDKSKLQISAMDEDVIRKRSEELGVEEEVQKVIEIFNSSRMAESEVTDYLVSTRPAFQKLLDLWSNSPLSKFTLTTVGIAIAQANFRRKTGETLDLSIWIK